MDVITLHKSLIFKNYVITPMLSLSKVQQYYDQQMRPYLGDGSLLVEDSEGTIARLNQFTFTDFTDELYEQVKQTSKRLWAKKVASAYAEKLGLSLTEYAYSFHLTVVLGTQKYNLLIHEACMPNGLALLGVLDMTYLSPIDYNVCFYDLQKGKELKNINLIVKNYFHPYSSLSETHREIVLMIAQGYDSTYIATVLEKTIETIKTYRKQIIKKFGCANFAQVIDLTFTNNPDIFIH